MTFVWVIGYVISILISVFAAKGSILALLVAVPFLWSAIKHITQHKTKTSMIPAAMAAWVISFSILNAFFPVDIPSFVKVVFSFMSSLLVGYGSFYARRRLSDQETKVEVEVKKEPFNLARKFAEMDKVVMQRKNKIKEYGWKGFFVDDIPLKKEENSLSFNLGKEIEIDKRRITKDS